MSTKKQRIAAGRRARKAWLKLQSAQRASDRARQKLQTARRASAQLRRHWLALCLNRKAEKP